MNKQRQFLARATCAVALWLFLFPAFAAAPEKADIFVQLGHSDWIKAVAFSPNGRTLVSGSYDKTLKLWDVTSGRELRTLSGHSDHVYDVAFSPDGRTVASASLDTTVKLWDVGSGRELRSMPNHNSVAQAVAFSPDGRIIASAAGTDSGVVYLWDVASGKELRALNRTRNRIHSIAFSPDGRTLAIGTWLEVKLWDIESGRELQSVRVHDKFVNALAFSPDGKTLASGSEDRTIKLLDASSGQELRVLGRHGGTVNAVAFSPDGRMLVSSSNVDDTPKLWDVASGRELRALVGHSGGVSSVAFSSNGNTIVSSGGLDNTLKLWDATSGRELQSLGGRRNTVSAAVCSPDGRQVVSASDLSLTFWEISTGRQLRLLAGQSKVHSLALSSDGQTIATGNDDKTVKLWDATNGHVVHTLGPHRSDVRNVSFSADGKYLASWGGFDDGIRIWDPTTGRELHNLAATGGVFAFSPDSRLLLSVVGDGGVSGVTFKLWDVASGKEVRSVAEQHHYLVSSIAFSPDGRTFAIGTAFGKVKILDLVDGRVIHEMAGHTKGVWTVAFSPDGSLIASASGDGSVRIWRSTSGKELRKLNAHTGELTTVVFSPDGRSVISAGEDGSVRTWDVTSGNEKVVLVSFKDGGWIAMTPQGYYTGSEKADQHVNVRIGNKVYGVDQYREKFYRPDLVKLALAGKPLTGMASIGSVKPAPSVSIVDTPSSVGSDEATVKVKVADQGGGVGDVRVYLNGSAVSLERRNLAVAAVQGKAQVFSYKVRLVSGKNSLRAIAFNAENSMQSTDALHEIEAKIAAQKPSLYAVVVGIQEYVNPKLTLKYSVADANLFADSLKGKATGLFEKVEVVKLVTAKDTTNTSITNTLKAVRAKVRPDDLFVFYVASHGTVDEGEYFLVTSNVGSTSTEKLKRDALSQNSLKELIANIPATKKLIVLDTCNAGKLGDTLQVALLTRGMNEDTAFKILSRAVGSTILSAATSQQEALEGYQNHGLFTWVLAEGLNGAADLDKDGFIKTIELASYVDDKVPELAEKVFRHKQFPVVAPSGQAFPVVRVR